MNPDLLRVVLVATRNPLNIGAAARAMSNFGFRELRLVTPYDLAFREAKSAVNAAQVMAAARVFPSVAEAIADCTLVVGTTSIGHRELQHPLRRLEYGGRLLRAHLADASAALLFGSEKFGLSNDDLSYCNWLVRIGTRQEHGSMNLGQAVAVCLYELTRRVTVNKPGARVTATAAEMERLTTLLNELLQISGYVQSPSTPAKVRRLVRRCELQRHDAEVWLGILRQLRWKLGQPADAMLNASDEGSTEL